MHRCVRFAAIVAVLSVPLAAHAQSDTFHVDIDAQVGLQALEEPVKSTDPSAPPTNETNTYVRLDAGILAQAHVFQAYLAAPLRFNIDGFALREADWDERHEVLRAFRCLRLDYMREDGSLTRYTEHGECASWTPDENVGAISATRSDFAYTSLRLNPVNNYSLGYGSIVDGFTADLEENDYVTGLGFDLNINRFMVMSAILADVASPDVMGGRIAARPLQRSNYRAGEYGQYSSVTERNVFMEAGFTAMSDIGAPRTVFDAPTATISTEQEVVTVIGGDIRIRTDSEATEYMHDYKVTRFEFGAEYNHILGYDGGAHGHLRVYHDVGWVDFYVDAEYRYVGANYIPRYFDQHYNVQRVQYLLSTAQREGTTVQSRAMTKLDALAGRAGNGDHGYAAQSRFRFWLPQEDGGGWRRFTDLRFFVEGVPSRTSSNSAGVELTVVNIAQKLDVMGRFAQQGWDSPKDIFTLQNSLLTVFATYDLTDELYAAFNYDRSWFLQGNGDYETTNNVGLNLGVRY